MTDKKNDKVSFQAVLRTYDSLIRHTAISTVIFSEDRVLPHTFLLEESEEGERRILRDEGYGVVRYVSESMLVNSLLTFSKKLPEVQFKNYVLDVDKAKKVAKFWMGSNVPIRGKIYPVLQQSTKGYTFHRLDFDKQEGETEIFDYLVSTLETNQEAFIAYLGALFDPNAKCQQFLWLQGPGGDGKGTILRLLAKIFQQSYVSVSTEARDIDKFWQSSLVGKRVAVCGDTRNLNFVNSSIFMQITGGDAVSIRPMQEKAYTTKLDIMFVFSANAAPLAGSEASTKRRAIICEMQPGKQKHIENFEQRLWDERAGIVHKCFSAWEKVKHLREIPIDSKVLKELAEDTEEKLECLTDRHFQVDPEGYIPATLVRTILSENEKRPPNNAEVSEWKRYIKRTYGVEIRRMRAGEKGYTSSKDRKRYYFGIKERRGANDSQGEGVIF